MDFGGADQSGMKLEMETLSANGVLIPAEGNWKPGYKWSAQYDTKAQLHGAGSGPGSTMQSKVTIENEIVGEEAVTVPAGTFNAFKVKSQIRQTGTMTVGQGTAATSMPLNLSLDIVAYHAKGVGMVKSMIEKMATIELIALTK